MSDADRKNQDTSDVFEPAEPITEWPDGNGGFYRLYTGVTLQITERGEVEVVKPKVSPEPHQVRIGESLKEFLRNGGEEWLQSRHSKSK
jgi:hypothetical protein